MRARWTAVFLWTRAEQRRGWRSTLAVGILVGFAIGAAAAAGAGARRTASAYDDLVAGTDAADLLVGPSCDDGESEADCEADSPGRVTALAATLRDHPMVADVAAGSSSSIPVTNRDGELLQPDQDGCFTGSGELTVGVANDGRFGTTMHRARIVEGRNADADAPDEAVLSYEAATDHGVHAGDRILAYFDAVDCGDEAAWGPPTELTVTGLAIAAGEVRPTSGRYLQSLRVHPSHGADEPEILAVRLHDGVTVEEFLRADLPLTVGLRFDTLAADVEDGLRRDAAALWLVAFIGALASLLVVAPALVRFAGKSAPDEATALAIGWTRRERIASGAVRGAAVGAVASVVVAALAVLTSLLTPIGEGHIIEPRHRIAVDPLVIVIGVAAAFIVSTLLVALVAARRSSTAVNPARKSQSAIGRALGAGRGRPVVGTGLRIAFDPLRRTAVWTSVVSMVLGIATVAGVLVYTASAQKLDEQPDYIGYTWDDFIYAGDISGRELARTAATWPEIERTGSVVVFLPELVIGEGDRSVRSTTFAFGTERGSIEPTAISGRAPQAANEILLNPLLAADLAVDIGDVVPATFGAESADFEVVGLGPVPVLAAEFAKGSAITAGALERIVPADQLTGEPDFVMIDRAPGARESDLAAKLERAGVSPDDALDPSLDLGRTVGLEPTRTESAPKLLGILMLVITTAVLAFTLTMLIRDRTAELTVLRAMGLTRWQTRRACAVAGACVVAVVCTGAVALGAVVGGQVWRSYADGLGVVARVHVPGNEMLVLVVAGIAFSVALSVLAARTQLRQRVGQLLRTE